MSAVSSLAGAEPSAHHWIAASAQCSSPVGRVRSVHWGLGALWVGTDNGLYEIDANDCCTHRDQVRISSMTDDGEVLWAAEELGDPLWRLKDDQWSRYNGSVRSVVAKQVTGRPCYRLWGSRDTFADPEVYDGIPFLHPGEMVLYAGADAALWVLYRTDAIYPVVRFDGKGLECWEEADVPARPLSIAGFPQSSRVWVTGWSGVSACDDTTWTQVPNSPIGLTDITVDHQDVVWGRDADGGLYSYAGRAWRRHEVGSVQALAAAKAHGIWVSTSEPSVLLLRDGYATPVGHPVAQSSGSVFIAADGMGRPWVADDSGVYYLDSPTPVEPVGWGEVKAHLSQ